MVQLRRTIGRIYWTTTAGVLVGACAVGAPNADAGSGGSESPPAGTTGGPPGGGDSTTSGDAGPGSSTGADPGNPPGTTTGPSSGSTGSGGGEGTTGATDGGGAVDTTGSGGATTGGDAPGACGNGVRDGDEECDGQDVGASACVDLGFAGGALGCTQACTLDFSQCTQCGNGTIDADEECDGANLGGVETCDQVGLGDASEPVVCTANCTHDYSMCSGCGDGIVTAPESCDGADLAGETCESQGFDRGVLACGSSCTFDVSGCQQCGDGIKDPIEECDDQDFGGLTCADYDATDGMPFESGSLACDASLCTVSTEACQRCGDGVVSGVEACDGAELNGETCESRGFTGGTLTCFDTCVTFDTSACTDCGNGEIDGGEACDGAALGDQTCESQGFDGGTLGCDDGCAFDTSACTRATCGDGVVNGSDACDGADLAGTGCTDLASPGSGNYGGGSLACASNCTFDTSGCTYCGDGSVSSPEVCDGSDLAGEDCASQGFQSGTLACSAQCEGFDTSGCMGVTQVLEVCQPMDVVIPDSNAAVVSSDLSFGEGMSVVDVRVTQLQIRHSYLSDLQVDLIHGGTTVRVQDRICGGLQDLGTDGPGVSLDDAASGPIGGVCNFTDPAVPSGSYTPSNPLSAFDGANPQGTWTLRIEDVFSIDGGALENWCLSITYE